MTARDVTLDSWRGSSPIAIDVSCDNALLRDLINCPDTACFKLVTCYDNLRYQ